MGKSIYILHERLTKGHFIGLEKMADELDIKLYYREFSIFKGFAKGIIRLDFKIFYKQILNCLFLISCLFNRNRKIVLGIAPIDFRLKLLKFFIHKHEIYYFTSWADWTGDNFPKKNWFGNNYFFLAWKCFLEKEISGLICVTDTAADSIHEHFEIQCKTTVVYHSITNKVNLDLRKRIGSKLRLVYVGRLEHSKRILELFEIMSKLDDDKFELTIVGNGTLEDIVKLECDKFTNIEFVGFVPHKRIDEIYKNSDLQLLLTRDFELFGMVIIEAMAEGVPTIATNQIGPQLLITNHVNGFLVEDSESTVEQAVTILKSIDSGMLERMARESLKKASAFEHTKISERWKEAIQYE